MADRMRSMVGHSQRPTSSMAYESHMSQLDAHLERKQCFGLYNFERGIIAFSFSILLVASIIVVVGQPIMIAG